MMERDGLGARVLQRQGLDKARLWHIVQRCNGAGSPGRPEQGLTFRARQAVEKAAQEARQLQQGYIGTEHLLLGILRQNDCGGAAALTVGAALIYPPAGWITGGVLAILGGVLEAIGGGEGK